MEIFNEMNLKKDEQILELILPEYKNFRNQPEIFVKVNKENNKYSDENNSEKEYFQNVSLLGERGSGKTSALNNLISYLKSKNNYIVFDLITPETINEEEDLLGWIITLVTEESNKILKNIKYREQCECEYNEKMISKSQDLNRKINELKESYFLRRSTYNEIIVNDTSSTLEYIEKKSKKLKADTNLKKNFNKLIDEIIKVSKKKMLIFLFDDVDIYSSKVCEVLKIIMNYLSHKNIVTYIAGDYNTFIENVTIELIKNEDLLDINLLKCDFSLEKQSVEDIRRMRAYEFIKKVLPPAYRYQIPKISNERKFKIIKSYKDSSFAKLLDRLVDKKYLIYNEEIIFDYFDFLDDKIRGLTNTIEFVNKEYGVLLNEIEEIKASIKEKDKERYEIGKLTFNYLSRLLDVLIHSNIKLEMNAYVIKNIFNIPNYYDFSNKNRTEFTGYINYTFIIDELEKKEREFEKKDFVYFYKILILSNFLEILIINLELDFRGYNLHGEEELLVILNSINKNGRLFPKLDDIKALIFLKQKMFEKLRYEEIQSLFKIESSDYLRYIYLKTFYYYKENSSKMEENEFMIRVVLKELFNKDNNWVKNQVDWIFESIFDNKKISEEIIKTIENKYNDIKYFTNFNGLKSQSLKEEECIQKEISLEKQITIEDTMNFFKIFQNNLKEKHNLERVKKILDIKTNELKELEKKINELQLDNNNIHKKIELINNMRSKLKKYLFLEYNKNRWENFKDDLKIFNFKVVEEELIDELNEKFTFVHVTLEEACDLETLSILEIENITCTIAIPKNNIFSLVEFDFKEFIKSYYSRMLLLDELNQSNILKYYNISDNIIKKKDEIEYINEEKRIKENTINNEEKILLDNKIVIIFFEKNIQEINKCLDNDEFKNKLFDFIYSQIKKSINLSVYSDNYDKLFYLDIMIGKIYKILKEDIFIKFDQIDNSIEILNDTLDYIDVNEDTEFWGEISYFKMQLDNMEKYNYSALNILKNNLIMFLDYIKNYNKRKEKNYSSSTIKRSLRLINNCLRLINELLNDKDENIKILQSEIFLNILDYLLLKYIQIQLLDKENVFKKRTIDSELKNIKKELIKFADSNSINAFKSYLENFNKINEENNNVK